MVATSNLPFYSGTSGLVLTIPKRLFPPEFKDKTRLQYYASKYNSIEINSSFYKIPMASTVGRWADEVPAGFRFSFKLWKGITHNKQLAFNPEDVDHFIKTIDHAGNRKGCLLIQFPPSLTIANIAQLKKLLTCVCTANRQQPWPTAVEFRNTSWYNSELYELLDEHKMSLVIHDHPSSITPSTDINTVLVFMRFHGVNGDYKGSYSEEFLRLQAVKIREWLVAGKTVYTYFNNTIGDAVANLELLNGFVKKN